MAGSSGADIAAALQQRLQSDWRSAVLRTIDERRKVWNAVREIYTGRDHKPVWLNDDSANERRTALLTALGRADSHGLDVEEYRSSAATRGVGESDSPGIPDDAHAASAWELDLTAAMLAYAFDMWDGRVEPRDVSDSHEVHLRRPPLDPQQLVADIESRGAELALASLAPNHPDYEALRDALARAREENDDRTEPRLDPPDLLREGDAGEHVHLVISKLAARGYYTGEVPDDPKQAHYDEELAGAVEAFQKDQALNADGIVGPNTVAALNRSASERVSQIIVNLDRWRWLPRDFGPRYIIVNIPEYRLRLYSGKGSAREMPVVVGSTVNRTPIFSDRMEHLVFHPYWKVPYSIVSNELLPQFREDPNVVREKHMEILDTEGRVMDPADIDWERISAGDIRVRQKPGPENSLGLVKFMFPNSHAIYLHDTPVDELFAKSRRDFSHGCIRVARPADLASWLLSDQQQWSSSEIDQAMQAGPRQEVPLTEPIPVYLTYFTVTPGADGGVRFLADVYGHDEVMRRVMTTETGLGQATDIADPEDSGNP